MLFTKNDFIPKNKVKLKREKNQLDIKIIPSIKDSHGSATHVSGSTQGKNSLIMKFQHFTIILLNGSRILLFSPPFSDNVKLERTKFCLIYYYPPPSLTFPCIYKAPLTLYFDQLLKPTDVSILLIYRRGFFMKY